VAEIYPKNQPDLEKQFESEQDCRAYLEALRWPNGFLCSQCGGSEYWRMKTGVLECSACGHASSVIAGTVFQDTKLPLKTWFRAMWLMAGQKSGLSGGGVSPAFYRLFQKPRLHGGTSGKSARVNVPGNRG